MDYLDTGVSRLLVFLVGGKRFSLPITDVKQIVAFDKSEIYLLPIPNKKIIGLLNLRGQVVPLVQFPYGVAEQRKDGELRGIEVSHENISFVFLSEHIEGVRHSAECTALLGQELWKAINDGDVKK